MTLATLTETFNAGRGAVVGAVCLGWEDSRAYAAAAEAESAPLILQVGPGARAHTPLSVWAAMLRPLAEQASVPIAVHLDHGRSYDECRQAIDLGFTSVMYDGSLTPLEDNIADTARIAEIARAAGVSCEGEIGVVGYHGGAESHGADPAEAARFAAETGVDAMAVSVGNVHLQTQAGAGVDRPRLKAIMDAAPGVPLVIHGGSGVSAEDRAWMAAETAVRKVNIGTELRQTFGAALRRALADDPAMFDRTVILRAVEAPLTEAARAVIRGLRAP